METKQVDFEKKVRRFFDNRFIGEIVELKPASLNRHYIKFKPSRDVWFQIFDETIEVDSVDFEKRTISGFISNNAKLNVE